jgi:hypothetical protein
MAFSVEIQSIRDSEFAHFVPQTGKTFGNAISIHHGYDQHLMKMPKSAALVRSWAGRPVVAIEEHIVAK